MQKIQYPQQSPHGVRLIHRCRQRLLAQLLPRIVHRHWQVHVFRGGQAKQTLQVYLARRGIQQVSAAHDMRDALKSIVHHDCKLIGE